MGIIYTEREKCRGCYACIRNCPVKAIRVREGLAEVVQERCIACGICLQVCVSKAKQLESDIGVSWQLLGQYPSVIAVLSASFPAAFPEIRPRQLVTALKRLGFSEVMEDSFGAELMCREYARLLQENKDNSFISSSCPVVISYIEKYYPQLIGNLAPIVSPTIATGRLIKWQYNPEAKVVYIGPCVGRKAESRDEKVTGVIDAALSFAELKEMFAAKEIAAEFEEEEQFSGPKPNLGRLFAISGGLLKAAGLSDDILLSDVVNACGRDYMPHVLQEFAAGSIAAKFVSLCFCEGCIDGPVIDNDLSIFKRREIITNYALSEADPVQTERDMKEYAGIDLSRRFTNRSITLPAPSEEEIQGVLEIIGKVDPSYRMGCGACGYRSCRELAIAVCQGLAEPTMCWPYIHQKLKDSQEELLQAEKLTSLGQMAASIAHEINNPLAGVLVYTQLLAKKVAGDTLDKQVALDYLGKMDSEISRTSRIIRNLLDFARQSKPLLRPVDSNQVIEQALSLVSHQAKLQDIEVIKELDPYLPKVTADFDQLQQVFTNLTLNAIQAIPDKGRLTLRTSLVGDGQIRVDVQDTGCGISKENLRKLFTPFFTTKEKGKGVGLGLAVVHGIIQRHQGRIEVQSKEGEGTTFTIYLPVHPEEEGGKQ